VCGHNVYLYICIYIYRERERERSIYIYIYTYALKVVCGKWFKMGCEFVLHTFMVLAVIRICSPLVRTRFRLWRSSVRPALEHQHRPVKAHCTCDDTHIRIITLTHTHQHRHRHRHRHNHTHRHTDTATQKQTDTYTHTNTQHIERQVQRVVYTNTDTDTDTQTDTHCEAIVTLLRTHSQSTSYRKFRTHSQSTSCQTGLRAASGLPLDGCRPLGLRVGVRRASRKTSQLCVTESMTDKQCNS
jgi:hypothetical protein